MDERDIANPEIECSEFSTKGRSTRANEDNVLVLHLPARSATGPKTLTVLAVADGMGGHTSGDIASAIAINGIAETFAALARRRRVTPNQIAAAMEEGFVHVHRRLRLLSSAGGGRATIGTTLTVAVVFDGRVHVGHVGDCRAYLSRGGRMWQLTRDDRVLDRLVQEGRISAIEAQRSATRNVLSQALGAEADIVVAHVTETLHPGDTLVLCSDGVHSALHAARIGAILNADGQVSLKARDLATAAVGAGSHDHASAVVARATGRLSQPRLSRLSALRKPLLVGVTAAALVFLGFALRMMMTSGGAGGGSAVGWVDFDLTVTVGAGAVTVEWQVPEGALLEVYGKFPKCRAPLRSGDRIEVEDAGPGAPKRPITTVLKVSVGDDGTAARLDVTPKGAARTARLLTGAGDPLLEKAGESAPIPSGCAGLVLAPAGAPELLEIVVVRPTLGGSGKSRS